MQTIVILLDPHKLTNADLDLRYLVPDRIEEWSHGAIQDNGYDYVETVEGRPVGSSFMGIWLKTQSADESWPQVLKLLQEETFLENDLSRSAEIYISEEDAADLEHCTRVFPDIFS